MRSHTLMLVRNELRMMRNHLKRMIFTPSMLAFYGLTIGGAFFLSMVATMFISLAPMMITIVDAMREFLTTETLLMALGLVTFSSILGGFFGTGPAAVLEEHDEYVMMPAPIHPYQLFVSRYTRRIVRKAAFFCVAIVAFYPIISTYIEFTPIFLGLMAAFILFLEFNYLMGGISAYIKFKLQSRLGRITYLVPILLGGLVLLPSSPYLSENASMTLFNPPNALGIYLLHALGFIILDFAPEIMILFVGMAFFIALLALANLCDTQYYEVFSANPRDERSESRFNRYFRGEIDFSNSRFDDPVAWIILKDFWSRMRSPLQFWKYFYIIAGIISVVWLHLTQPFWLPPARLPPTLFPSAILAFLLLMIIFVQLASMTSLLSFIDERDNIYLLMSSPFRRLDIILAKYMGSVFEVSLAAVPLLGFLGYFFTISGSFALLFLSVPLIMIFCSTGVLIGAYVPVFTSNLQEPPVPLVFSFPAINMVLGGCMMWLVYQFSSSYLLMLILPSYTLLWVAVFLILAVVALSSYK